MKRKTIAIDFDGTIAEYKTFKGKGIFGEPLPGVWEAFAQFVKEDCRIIVFTTRHEVSAIREYMRRWGLPFDYINHNPANVDLDCSPCKVLADVYIDDRAVTFKGRWTPRFVEEVLRFQSHYKKEE